MKFAITGHGRSGTKFLAREMNRSPTWNVIHEPNEDLHLDSIAKRFKNSGRSNYGEVNSFLLYTFRDLPVDMRGVLIRDPLDIAVSVVNCGHPVSKISCDYLASSMALIDAAIESCKGDVQLIRFRDLVSDLAYLKRVVNAFGIMDIPDDELTLSVVNESAKSVAYAFSDLSRHDRGMIERPVRWFREKYSWCFE